MSTVIGAMFVMELPNNFLLDFCGDINIKNDAKTLGIIKQI